MGSSFFKRSRRERVRDLRQEMIDDMGDFLSHALNGEQEVPRIPIKMAGEGGFGKLMKMPGARQLATNWWAKAVERLPD